MDSAGMSLLLAGMLSMALFAQWITGLTSRAPVLIHNIVWIVALAIVGSGLLHYTPNSGYAWALIAGGIVAFNLGAILPTIARWRTPERVHGTLQPLVTRRRYQLLIAAYSLGVAYYLWNLSSRYGLGTLISDPGSIRAVREGDSYLSVPLPVKLLYYLGPLLFVMTLNPWTIKNAPSAFARLGVFAYLVISQAALLQRTNLFISFFWQVGLLLIEPPNIKARRREARRPAEGRSRREKRRRTRLLVASGLLAVVAFQFIGNALGKTTQTADVELNVAPVLKGSAWSSVLIYMSSGIPAFGQLVESTNHSAPPAIRQEPILEGDYNPQTWGRSTFQAPLKIVPLAPPWEEIAPFTRIPFQTNVYTWFEPYYRDFRGVGVLVMTFALGLGVAAVHRRRGIDSGWLLLAALLVGLSAWAPFTNRYGAVMTIELAVLTLGLGRASVRAQSPPRVPISA